MRSRSIQGRGAEASRRWKRVLHCLVLSLLLLATTATAASAAEPARYHGGDVQHNPHLYAIFWGSSWTEGKNATQRAETEEFFKTASGSSWQGILTQYFDENGAVSSSVAFTSYLDKSVSAPTNVTIDTVEKEFANAVALNGWSHTNDDQFMVMLPAGTTYGEGMSGFCGLHVTVHENDLEGTGLQGVAWSVAKGSCTLTTVATHEFAETVTDRYPSKPAWLRSVGNGGDEIADGCGSGQLANGMTVQMLWDNHLHSCTLADANPPRLYAITENATGLDAHTATLNGLINPAGRATTYRFEYGRTTSYGSSAPVSEVDAGSGWKTLDVKTTVQGLEPDVTFHYRIVANNSSGQNVGEDLTFVTQGKHAPENTVLPSISPTTPNRGAPAVASTGSWTGESISYTYQWESRFPGTESWGAIGGATGSALTPGPGLAGRSLRVVVTASNAYGKVSATSEPSGPVRQIGDLAEYQLAKGSYPYAITSGPDGNLWFTERGKIAKMTPAGQVLGEYTPPSYPVGELHSPSAIVTGPDGNLWFTATWSGGRIGRITPSGTITEYTLPRAGEPNSIVVGPDGNLWFTTMTEWVGKITTAGAITEYRGLASGLHSYKITSGPDGNLWVSDHTIGGNLWKVSTGGVRTEVPIPNTNPPGDLVAGPDGNVWFTVVPGKAIGKVLPATGAVTEYPVSEDEGNWATGLAAGPDGNLWYTIYHGIGRIKPTGAVTVYSLGNDNAWGVTEGPDGRMWTANWSESSKIFAIAP